MKSQTLTTIYLEILVHSDREENVAQDLEARMKDPNVQIETAKKVLESSAVKSAKTLNVVYKVRNYDWALTLGVGPYQYKVSHKVGRIVTYVL